MNVGFSTFILIVGSVAVIALLLGAAFRPQIDYWLDRLSKTLRVVILDNRRATFILPEGVSIAWEGKNFSRIYQQQFHVHNSTRAVFDDVALRLHYTPYRALEPGEDLFFAALMVPTAVAVSALEPAVMPDERILRYSFIAPDSLVEVRTFANVDGDLTIQSACDKMISVRRRGEHVSESAQRVLPRWVIALRPIFLPITFIMLLLRRRG
ncbi:MAG: hypothetical protein ACK4TG_08305 [Thermaurantiacus sp.]